MNEKNKKVLRTYIRAYRMGMFHFILIGVLGWGGGMAVLMSIRYYFEGKTFLSFDYLFLLMIVHIGGFFWGVSMWIFSVFYTAVQNESRVI